MWRTKFKRCIYQSPSNFKVYQNLLFRWLTLDSDAIQTLIPRWNHSRIALKYLPSFIFLIKHFPGNTLLLGLGGGAIPSIFCKLKSNIKLDVVEISSEIIQIAHRYFYIDECPNLTIIHAKAQDFLAQTGNQYQHLIIDLCEEQYFPQECLSSNFIANCKKVLHEKGYISINVANQKEHIILLNLLKQHFRFTLAIQIPQCQNLILISMKTDSFDLFYKEVLSNKYLTQVCWIEGWGYVGKCKKSNCNQW